MPPRSVHDVLVEGISVGPETRCAHYDTKQDVIALRFGCCDEYYPCYRCHRAVANHRPEPWPESRFDEPAVLCGVCGAELTVGEYRGSDHACPDCDASFNPGCRNHEHLYFEV